MGTSDNESSSKTPKNVSEPSKFKMDEESYEKKLPYPKSVFFIVSNEFCERFSYYGMKAVLTLYLKNVLNFSEDSATVIYHVFSMACYFTPLFGAMLADSLLGKFRTIFYLSIVYAAGNVLLALAATPPINLPNIPFSMLGLGLIAIGTGGIKPCVAAFGGDQFVLPQQAAQLATFFSFFYMAINSGSLISTFITPIMRKDVQCFDQDTCYSLAFSIPAALMVTSLIIFLLGKFLYRETKPTGNVVLKVLKCIGHAISRKRKTKDNRDHWLDNADDTYEPRFIEDVKIVLRVLVLYLPLPLFWALFDQQGSRWTLQATRMDGVTFGYTIKPDQVQVLNPALILIFIPLFDKLVYPIFSKINFLKRPLQRLTAGGILAGVAFVISGILELELEKTYPNRLSTSEANLNFINTLSCDVEISINGARQRINSYENYVFEGIEAKLYTLNNSTFNIIAEPNNANCSADKFVFGEFKINGKKSDAEFEEQKGEVEHERGGGFTFLISSYMDMNNKKIVNLIATDKSDDREKPKEGNPKLKFLLHGRFLDTFNNITNTYVYLDGDKDKDFDFKLMKNNNTEEGTYDGYSTETIEVEPIEYEMIMAGPFNSTNSFRVILPPIELKLGGSYVITVTESDEYDNLKNLSDPNSYNVILTTITKESSLHMLWLLPQYIVITAGEIMFSITGLEFSYSQSPVSMKSVMQSAWLLTVAFGNLIVVIIAEAKFFDEQSKEFFLFAGLMFVDMIWFMYMAWKYVPAVLEDPNAETKKKESD